MLRDCVRFTREAYVKKDIENFFDVIMKISKISVPDGLLNSRHRTTTCRCIVNDSGCESGHARRGTSMSRGGPYCIPLTSTQNKDICQQPVGGIVNDSGCESGHARKGTFDVSRGGPYCIPSTSKEHLMTRNTVVIPKEFTSLTREELGLDDNDQDPMAG